MTQALGLVQTPGVLSAVVLTDQALKTASVELRQVASAGGGLTTIVLEGEIAAVRTAVESAEADAEVSTTVLANPSEEVERLLGEVGGDVGGSAAFGDGGRALGVIEVLGLEALTRAVDALAKAAGIEIASYQRVGGGLTAICVWGDVAAVRTAIDAADRAADLARSTVLAHPHPGIAPVMELYR